MSAEGARQSRKAKKDRKKSLFWLTEAQVALTWGALIGLAALVGAIYLFQTSRIATTGRQVQFLQYELDSIKQDNIELERDIAEAQALDRLREDSLKLGFTRSTPDDVEFLVIPDYPNAPEEIAAPENETQGEPAENMLEALWLALQDSVGNLIHGESR